MQLTKNFSLEELTVTETGLSNIPDSNSQRALLYLAVYILQPIRDACDRLKVTSGYRTMEINKVIGGAVNSQHLFGEAADIIPLDCTIDYAFDWIRHNSNLKWGQVIKEDKGGKQWIHISLPRLKGENQMVMVYENGVYKRI